MDAMVIATRAQARLFLVLFRRDLWVQYAWLAWSLPFEALNLVAGLVVWLFFARAFGNQAPFLQAYGGDIVAYLVLGMAVTPLLLRTMEQFYGQVKSLYTGSWSSSGVRLSMAEYLAIAMIPLRCVLPNTVFICGRLSALLKDWTSISSLLRTCTRFRLTLCGQRMPTINGIHYKLTPRLNPTP